MPTHTKSELTNIHSGRLLRSHLTATSHLTVLMASWTKRDRTLESVLYLMKCRGTGPGVFTPLWTPCVLLSGVVFESGLFLWASFGLYIELRAPVDLEWDHHTTCAFFHIPWVVDGSSWWWLTLLHKMLVSTEKHYQHKERDPQHSAIWFKWISLCGFNLSLPCLLLISNYANHLLRTLKCVMAYSNIN